MSRRILQIVPQRPGSRDGVSDYAFNLSRALAAEHGLTSDFLSAAEIVNIDTFPDYAAVILHYVNYGYQKRGVPFRLRNFVRAFCRRSDARCILTLHELSASGPPWKSAFWLRPWQIRIARDLIALADVCFVSNEVVAAQVRQLAPERQLRVAPVMSNLGEPEKIDFRAASPHRWAICGGTESIVRSLTSFAEIRTQIPAEVAPQQLEVIGGRDTAAVRELVTKLGREIDCQHHSEVSAAEASALLQRCAFAWLDYFGRGKVWPGLLPKSGVFAACCAHGVAPVLAHHEAAFAVDGDPIPGLWSIDDLPIGERLLDVRERLFAWYQAHAASSRIAQLYAECLR